MFVLPEFIVFALLLFVELFKLLLLLPLLLLLLPIRGPVRTFFGHDCIGHGHGAGYSAEMKKNLLLLQHITSSRNSTFLHLMHANLIVLIITSQL